MGKIDIRFEDLWLFALGVLIPGLVIWYIYFNKRSSAELYFSSVSFIKKLPRTFRQRTRIVPFILRLLTIAVVITALARPRGHIGREEVTREGIDIMMAMDVSVSMLSQDFDTNRLNVSKRLAQEFIDGRPDDRFGLVAFSGESVTRCALTTDHALVKKKIAELKERILPDGTAIGMGLGTSVARLRSSTAKSKVVILLTDGENNMGVISPTTAAELAQVFGIRVYTIGVGSTGKALSPVGIKPNGDFVFDYIDVKIDEPMLKNIAEMTGGKYFRATDEESMRKIYTEIDQLEKTKIKVTEYKNKPDRFFWFVVVAAGLFLLEYFLRLFVYRTVP